MGFLDHSTNNIIIDAVLTDEGRRQLASSDISTFRISYFSFGDDEIDYGIIKKYGRAVGKEKIIKNTPIFEAQTRGGLALKYRMLTIPDQTLTALPKLQFIASQNFVDLSMGKDTTVTFTQRIGSTNQTISEISDRNYTVIINSRFLNIPGSTSVGTEPGTRMSYYDINASTDSSTTTLTFKLASLSIDNTSFDLYARGGGNTINTIVTVIGNNSGTRYDLTVNINR